MNRPDVKKVRHVHILVLASILAAIMMPLPARQLAMAQQTAFHLMITGCLYGGSPGESPGFFIDPFPGNGPDEKPSYFMAVNAGSARTAIFIGLKTDGYAMDSYDPLTVSRIVDPFVSKVSWNVITGLTPRHVTALVLWNDTHRETPGKRTFLIPGSFSKSLARIMSDLGIPFRNGVPGTPQSAPAPLLIGVDGPGPFPIDRKAEVQFIPHEGPGNHHSIVISRPDTGDRIIYLTAWGTRPPSKIDPVRPDRGEVRAILVDLAPLEGSSWIPGAGGVPPEKIVEALLWCLGEDPTKKNRSIEQNDAIDTTGAARVAKMLKGRPVVIIGRHYGMGAVSIRKVGFLGSMGVKFLTATQGQSYEF